MKQMALVRGPEGQLWGKRVGRGRFLNYALPNETLETV